MGKDLQEPNPRKAHRRIEASGTVMCDCTSVAPLRTLSRFSRYASVCDLPNATWSTLLDPRKNLRRRGVRNQSKLTGCG